MKGIFIPEEVTLGMKVVSPQYDTYKRIIKIIEFRENAAAQIASGLAVEIINCEVIQDAVMVLEFLQRYDPFSFPIHPAATVIVDIKILLSEYLA